MIGSATKRLALPIACLGAVVSVLTSCSSSTSTSAHAGAPVRPDPPPLKVELTKRVTLGPDVGPVKAFDKVIAYPVSPDGKPGTVVTVDITTGRRTQVARSAFPEGFANWVGVSGDWVVYVDQSEKQGNGVDDVLWRIVATNTQTGQDRILQSNGSSPNPFVPWLGSRDGYVYWSSAESDRTARQHLWRAGWEKPRDVLRHAKLSPGTETVVDGYLIYLGSSTSRADGSDCWRVPLTGGTPEQLTSTGLAQGCASDGEWIVWSEHIGPDDENEDRSDNPYELWSAPINDIEKPQLLHRGYFMGSRPYVSNGLVVWVNWNDNRVVQDLAEPRRKKIFKGSAPGIAAASSGDIFVFGSKSANRRTTVADLFRIKRN